MSYFTSPRPIVPFQWTYKSCVYENVVCWNNRNLHYLTIFYEWLKLIFDGFNLVEMLVVIYKVSFMFCVLFELDNGWPTGRLYRREWIWPHVLLEMKCILRSIKHIFMVVCLRISVNVRRKGTLVEYTENLFVYIVKRTSITESSF